MALSTIEPANGRWFEPLEQARFLAEEIEPDRKVKIVDVGANPIEGEAPYKTLLDAGLCEVVGFEPNPEARVQLDEVKGENETYLPYAVGDGETHTLHFYRHSGLTSLFPLKQRTIRNVVGFQHSGKLIKTEEVDTVRLDDLEQIEQVDFLKIDAQGAELMIFQNARQRLATALAVQTEVRFTQLYEDEPGFGDINTEMLNGGFEPHNLLTVNRFKFENSKRHETRRRIGHQAIDGDMIYIRSLTDLETLSTSDLKILALLCDSAFFSHDVAIACIDRLVERNEANEDLPSRYLAQMFHRLK